MELSTTCNTLFLKFHYISKIEFINLSNMEEKELRAILANNIKKHRNRRNWSQQVLAEKIDISANYLSAVETGKGWVSPLTLVKLANKFEIEVSELFLLENNQHSTKNDSDNEKIKRFAKNLTLALDTSTEEISKFLKSTIEKVCKEHLC